MDSFRLPIRPVEYNQLIEANNSQQYRFLGVNNEHHEKLQTYTSPNKGVNTSKSTILKII